MCRPDHCITSRAWTASGLRALPRRRFSLILLSRPLSCPAIGPIPEFGANKGAAVLRWAC